MLRNIGICCVLLTLIAGMAAAGSSQQPALVYPQFAVGGGFEVVLILTNAGDTPFEGWFLLPEFGPTSGRGWLLNGADQSGSDRAPVALPPLATRRFQLAAPEGAEATAGSLQIEADPGSSVDNLAAAFYYEFSLGGELVDTIGVPSASPSYHITIPVERSPQARVNTGLAIRARADSSVAPAGEPEAPVYRIALLGENGDLLDERFTSFLGARFFDQLFPGRVAPGVPFTGALQVESETPLYLVALRQQLLDGGRFQLTGIPGSTPRDDTPAASFSARYRVTFQATWAAQTHPTDFPPGPHFSRLIGGIHNSGASFWEPGGTASLGIEQMAEMGATFALADEVQFEIDRGTAGAVVRGPGGSLSPGSVSLEFNLDRRFPLVTLVSMIAPSPDWFVGVHDLALFEAGDWLDEIEVQLYPYDAGTDSGPTYLSPGQDTQPREPIRRITGAPFLNQGEVLPMGTFRFERMDR